MCTSSTLLLIIRPRTVECQSGRDGVAVSVVAGTPDLMSSVSLTVNVNVTKS